MSHTNHDSLNKRSKVGGKDCVCQGTRIIPRIKKLEVQKVLKLQMMMGRILASFPYVSLQLS
jgi:hypothetical protein